jgi:ribosomal protein S7
MEKICFNSQYFQEKNYKPKLLTRLILKKIIMKGKKTIQGNIVAIYSVS